MQYAQDRGAKQITLDVIDGNLPAYKLYEHQGFSHYSGQAELIYQPNGAVEDVPLPEGYALEERDLLNWRPSFALAQRIVPEQGRDACRRLAAIARQLVELLRPDSNDEQD